MSAPTSYPIDEALIAEVYRLGLGGEEAKLPRHRHDLTREQVETTQKARIILATAEAVTAESYARTSTRTIIERAGVSSKTFYAHYASKEEAFLAGYTLLDGVMLSHMKQPVKIDEPRAATRAAVKSSLESLAAWPLFARMRLVEGRAAGPIADQRRLEMARSLISSMMRTIEASRTLDPRIGTPTEGAVAVLIAGMSELMTRHVIEHGAETLPELAPALVEAVERFTYGDPPPYLPGE
ncbi:MAG: TetR/AcrR family transcriptional regulator [Solirubrobacteraceae bacterium]|nr:TetR/AcrR family transcriptional regulator [Solirubrobacteraceae bacterium]